MAKLNAGEVTRGETWAIDPENIVVNHEENRSRWQPHDEASVMELVNSYETDGQLQPVQVRKIEDGKVKLVFGFRRYMAALKFNELHPDKPMKLKCIVVNCNEEEAFRRNVEENRNRKEVSQVDDAYAARELMERFNWNQTKVAEFFRTDPGHISQILQLLKLPKETQLQVHNKQLSFQAALGIAKLPEAEQKPILTEISKEIENNGGGKVSTATVTQRVRQVAQNNGGKVARSMKELMDGVMGLTGPAETPLLRGVCQEFIKFREGKTSEKTFEKNMRKWCGEPDPAKVAEKAEK